MLKAYKKSIADGPYRSSSQTGDLEIHCPLGCGVSYVVFYDPRLVDDQILSYCRQAVEVGMHGCSLHPGKIEIPGTGPPFST